MKSQKFSLVPLWIIIFGFTIQIYGQELAIQNYIGRSLDDVISNFGKPDHKDFASESMKCIFYKTKTYQYVFVADQEGIYQAEGTLSFSSKGAAMKEMDDFLKNCMEKGLEPDTLGVTDYNIQCSGAKVDLTLFENKYSKQYQIKVKANRTE